MEPTITIPLDRAAQLIIDLRAEHAGKTLTAYAFRAPASVNVYYLTVLIGIPVMVIPIVGTTLLELANQVSIDVHLMKPYPVLLNTVNVEGIVNSFIAAREKRYNTKPKVEYVEDGE